VPSLIKRKREKAYSIFEALGEFCTEDSFIERFKELYEKDWILIQNHFEKEVQNAMPGKKQPMPHPDVYMKEMYQHFKNRRDAEILGVGRK
jgi:hypothetical protein